MNVLTRSAGIGTGQVSLPDVHFAFCNQHESTTKNCRRKVMARSIWAHDPYRGKCQQLNTCRDLKVLLLSNDRDYDNGALNAINDSLEMLRYFLEFVPKNKVKLAEVVACSRTPLLLTSKTEE